MSAAPARSQGWEAGCPREMPGDAAGTWVSPGCAHWDVPQLLTPSLHQGGRQQPTVRSHLLWFTVRKIQGSSIPGPRSHMLQVWSLLVGGGGFQLAPICSLTAQG